MTLLKPYFCPWTILLLLSYTQSFYDCQQQYKDDSVPYSSTFSPVLTFSSLAIHFSHMLSCFYFLHTCTLVLASLPSTSSSVLYLVSLSLLCQVSSIIPTCGHCSVQLSLSPHCHSASFTLRFCRSFCTYCFFTQFNAHGLTRSSWHSFN